MRGLPVLLVFLLCLAVPASSQGLRGCGVARLSDAAEFSLNLGAYACAIADESRALTLEDVFGPEGDALFAPVPGNLIDFGFGTGRYWVRVLLENTSSDPGLWWVTHDIPVAELVQVHLVPDGAPSASARTLLSYRATDPFDARPIPHRHLVSEITLAPKAKATLLIAYTSDQATEMPLFVESVPHFVARTQSETLWIVMLTALVLGMGLINTVYLYGLDGRPALAYGSYMLGGVLLLTHIEGYTFQYVWPNAPGFNNAALAMIALISVALGALFVDRFTETARHAPRLHRAAMGTIAALAALAALSWVLLSSIWFKFALLAAVVAGTAMQVVLASAALRRGQAGAGTLLLGFGALAVSLLVGVAGYLTEGLFEQEVAGVAIRLGFLTEATAFSAAIALRIRAARRERDHSLREQLRLSEDRLYLSEALRRAEDDRLEASRAADRSREALASAAHDIRQPLTSLQMALSGQGEQREGVETSLNYLREIVRVGLEEANAPLGAGDADPVSRGSRERFTADIILRNIEAMFGAEAADQGTALLVVTCTKDLVADPLALMRMVGNLVSNALQHAGAGRVLVGCRRSATALCLEVHDTGSGLSLAELARVTRRGETGATSGGHGLGLSIVTELAAEHGLAFEMQSWPGRGTVARICVPNDDTEIVLSRASTPTGEAP